MRILIVNPFGIGDVLFTVPVIKALKENFKDASIGYLCNARTKDIIETNPSIDKLFVYEKDEYRKLWKSSKVACIKKSLGLVKEIKDARYDVALDYSLAPEMGIFLWLCGIKQRIGFNYKNRGRFLTQKVLMKGYKEKHVIDYYLELLTSLGIKPISEPKLELFLKDEDVKWAKEFLKDNGVVEGARVVGIVPGGGESWGVDAKYRLWDEKNFAKLADHIVERYKCSLILLGGPSEVERCSRVIRMMKAKPISACGKTSLRQYAALMKLCSVVISNDGGPLHTAVAVGARTISLFGPVDTKVYGPYSKDRDRHVIITAGLSCQPCYKDFKLKKCEKPLCMEAIDVNDVIKVIDSLLRSE